MIPLLFLLLFSPPTLSQPQSYLLDCGSSTTTTSSPFNLTFLPDFPFILSGTPRTLPNPENFLDHLSTLRSFPPSPNKKFCYLFPSPRFYRFLIRATFFYGNFDGRGIPSVFDLVVDGTVWAVVNTTADYRSGRASFYEGVFMGVGKGVSVCVAANEEYTVSEMFVSAIEVRRLEEDSVYNVTDFRRNALGLIARTDFGAVGSVVRYPDDKYDRYWQPFSDSTHALSSTYNVSESDIWNLPPAVIFNSALEANQGKPLVLQWPPVSLPNSTYYVALYFADTLSGSSRTFNVFINEYSFYSNLDVTSSPLVVFASDWILSGLTKITMTHESDLSPLLNAGEVFGLFPVGKVTHTRDIISLENIKKSIDSPPLDWRGDPCMPPEYSWTGIKCSNGTRIRVIELNISSMALSGTMSPSINNLTALTDISFANNNFSGLIPNLTSLKMLKRLHLQDNQLSGTIPASLANLTILQELYLENNNLSGPVPPALLNRRNQGLDLRF